MDSQIEQFLNSHRIGCLTVLLSNGQPHAATVHYSHSSEPLKIYIQTGKDTQKCQKLLQDKVSPASFVVGFSEEEWQTLQLDGQVRLLETDEEIKQFQDVHHQKVSEAKRAEDKETAYLEFTSENGKFSDFTTKPPTVKTI